MPRAPSPGLAFEVPDSITVIRLSLQHGDSQSVLITYQTGD
jgi:hypothetical protein